MLFRRRVSTEFTISDSRLGTQSRVAADVSWFSHLRRLRCPSNGVQVGHTMLMEHLESASNLLSFFPYLLWGVLAVR
jgi:hypothetical protein